ncbi:TolC family outer membrane protein [Pollutimonas sp. M17]|uniref:TolC family outer membrane protein n=1 Tax=Pollutimonas sp. M17 TaxID=2962065 RepID=UPI0021F42986|nr:TolC family outer membrane protein [Pollutimonas sp. M17]UYO93542.1 TolC family outer membrane protein [Pollutimonas sp. M17]
MLKFSLRPFTISLALAAATPVCGAASSGTTVASLPEVVERTVLQNPEIKARYQDFVSSLEAQNVARGGYFPRVNAQGWTGREYRNSASGSGTDRWSRNGYNLELRQLIFDGFRTSGSVEQTGFEKLAKYYELQALTDATAAEAAQAYLDVQRYRELNTLAKENFALHEQTLAQIRERTASGVGRRVDLEQAVGRLALAQSNWLTEKGNLLDVEQRYMRITGSAPAVKLMAAPKSSFQMPENPEDFSAYMRGNPGLLSKQASVQAAGSGIDVAKSQFSPTLELRASTGTDRGQYGTDTRTHSTNVQLVMSYNLFNGGADRARIRQTTAQRYAQVDLRNHTCRNLYQDLSIAWNNVARLREQLPFLRAHRVATQKVRDGYHQQFQIGQRSLMDLLDTENELFQANRAYVNAQYEQRILEYRWLSLAHRILPALELAPPEVERPEEGSKLDLGEELLAACATAAPDTSLLTPVGIEYGEGEMPPTLVYEKS